MAIEKSVESVGMKVTVNHGEKKGRSSSPQRPTATSTRRHRRRLCGHRQSHHRHAGAHQREAGKGDRGRDD